MTLKEFSWWIIDHIFPILMASDDAREREKDEKQLKECRDRADSLDVEALEGAIASILKLVADEDDRRKGIDTRLATIVGLGSIAASIVIGATLAQPSTMAGHGPALRVLLGVLTFYITLQLCIAVYWAIRGLGRRNYESLTPDEFLPAPNEPVRKRLRDHLATLLGVFQQNRSTNNEKMGSMAVAHQASQNFIVGLGCLSLVGVLVFLIGPVDNGQGRDHLAGPPAVHVPQILAPPVNRSSQAAAPNRMGTASSTRAAAASTQSKKP